MGIPKFKGALKIVLGNAKIYKYVSMPCSALYIDCNAIVHPAIQGDRSRQLTDEDYPSLVKDVLACIKSVVLAYKPRDLVYISMDGPVPMSKIQEQRERRYFGATERQREDYSSNIITPGTNFMRVLDEEIRKTVGRADNDEYGVKKLVYSSHLVPGEGEHKIMKYIRENKRDVQSYVGSHVIYGNDSDWVLLGLCTKLKRVFICKDTVTLLDSGNRVVQEGDKNNELSIDSVREALSRTIGADKEQEFIFACSLLGNDFLPRSPAMSDIQQGLRVIVEFLAQGGTVIEDNCLSLFQALALEETFGDGTSDTLANLMLARHRKDPDEFRSRILPEVVKQKDYDDAFRYHWYVKFMLYAEFDSTSLPVIGTACLEYIRGLHWVYNYYTRGQDSVTWLWYYPYHHAPMFRDLATTVEAVLDGRILGGEILFRDIEPYEQEIRFTCLHQLVCVMPVQDITSLPLALNEFYSRTGPLAPFMPVTVLVNDELIELEWQTKAILPKIDYYLVMKTLSKRSFGHTMLSGYANTVDLPVNKIVRREQRTRESAEARETREPREPREPTSSKEVDVGKYIRSPEALKPARSSGVGYYPGTKPSFRGGSQPSRGGSRGGSQPSRGGSRGGSRGR